jgi:hypothetical protein
MPKQIIKPTAEWFATMSVQERAFWNSQDSDRTDVLSSPTRSTLNWLYLKGVTIFFTFDWWSLPINRKKVTDMIKAHPNGEDGQPLNAGTMANRYKAVLVVMKAMTRITGRGARRKVEHLHQSVIDYVEHQVELYRKKSDDLRDSSVFSAERRGKYIFYDELVAMALQSRDRWLANKSDKKLHQNWLILAINTLQPPLRADTYSMKIWRQGDPSDHLPLIKDGKSIPINYIRRNIQTGKWKYILNHDKMTDRQKRKNPQVWVRPAIVSRWRVEYSATWT